MIFAIVSYVECCNVKLPSWIITKLDIEESSYVIMQIQASLAVLPLAIIALITGIMKDRAYGISVMKYIMSLRPIFLNYKRLAIFQTINIVLSYISMTFGFYNHLEFFLILTITNTVILLTDCFGLLSNYQMYNEEIQSYIIKNPSYENINSLVNEIIQTKDVGSDIALQKEIYVLNTVLLKSYKDKNSFDDICSEYTKCLKNLFGTKRNDLILLALDTLIKEYTNFNTENLSLKIFDDLQFDFYDSLKYVNLSDVMKEGRISILRYELGKNCYYRDLNSSLLYFTARIYIFSVMKNIEYFNNKEIKTQFANSLYDSFTIYGEYQKIEQYNRLNFFKCIVDYKDEDILSKKIFDKPDIGFGHDCIFDQYYMILYMYYIGLCEPLIEKQKKEFILKFIESKKKLLNYIIEYNGITECKDKDIRIAYNLMREWEFFEINSVKTLIYEYVTDDFLVFSALVASHRYSFNENLEKIAKGKEFQLYNRYFGGKGVYDTKENYKNFCNLFDFNYNEIHMENLRVFLSNAFKNKSMLEAEENYKKLLESDFCNRAKNCIINTYTEFNRLFEAEADEIKTKHIVFINEEVYCSFLCEKDNKNFINWVNEIIVRRIMCLLKNNISIKEVGFNADKISILKKQENTLNKHSEYAVIGSLNCFNYNEEENAKKLLENKPSFLLDQINNAIYCVSQAETYLKISNIKVTLSDLTKEYILQENQSEESGLYKYNVSNNLECIFTEEEFIKYMQNEYITLKIEGDIESAFESDIIGYGIIVDYDK